jgi:hypothetical protein
LAVGLLIVNILIIMSHNDVGLDGAPPVRDSGIFQITTWNIRCGWNLGLSSAAKGLAKMGV